MAAHDAFADPDQINAAALLLARGAAAQPALVSASGTISYRDLRKTVAQAAGAWQDLGVEAGELVTLRGDHGLAHVIAFLGAIWAGIVPVPLRISSLDDTGATVCFATERPRDPRVQGPGGAAVLWRNWQQDLRGLPSVEPVACEPWAPACWTEPRSWDDDGALVLPHRFALGLMAKPGTLSLAQTASMLGVLRALRRGVTAVLQQAPPRPAYMMMEPAVA